MTKSILEYLRKVGVELEGELLNEGAQLLAQLAIELEAEEMIGAEGCKRSPNRKNHRDGHREQVWETQVGEIPLRVPKLREGMYFPRLLELRRRAEKALLAAVQTAYVKGVSIRKVDGLLKALRRKYCLRCSAGFTTPSGRTVR